MLDLEEIDEDGRMILHDRYFRGDSFILKLASDEKSLRAALDSELIILDLESIFASDKDGCRVRKTVMENIIKLQMSQTNRLDGKIDIYLEKNLRSKIIKYLKSLEKEVSRDTVYLPFNRSELAAYLSCDRSSLSRELSRMQNEGLIEMDRNKIRLINI